MLKFKEPKKLPKVTYLIHGSIMTKSSDVESI